MGSIYAGVPASAREINSSSSQTSIETDRFRRDGRPAAGSDHRESDSAGFHSSIASFCCRLPIGWPTNGAHLGILHRICPSLSRLLAPKWSAESIHLWHVRELCFARFLLGLNLLIHLGWVGDWSMFARQIAASRNLMAIFWCFIFTVDWIDHWRKIIRIFEQLFWQSNIRLSETCLQ